MVPQELWQLGEFLGDLRLGREALLNKSRNLPHYCYALSLLAHFLPDTLSIKSQLILCRIPDHHQT